MFHEVWELERFQSANVTFKVIRGHVKGGGSLWVQISEGRGSSTNDSWRQKTRVPELSRGVVCMILRLAVLIQYRHVTDRQIHRQTDTRWRLMPAHRWRRAGKKNGSRDPDHASAPRYLSDYIQNVTDSNSGRLRSSSSSQLVVRRTRLSTVGDRAFPVATPLEQSAAWRYLSSNADCFSKSPQNFPFLPIIS